MGFAVFYCERVLIAAGSVLIGLGLAYYLSIIYHSL